VPAILAIITIVLIVALWLDTAKLTQESLFFSQSCAGMALAMNRVPAILAIITIVLIVALWHKRDGIHSYSPLYGSHSKPLPSFYEIATKFGTDKVNSHHYERMYEHRLAPLRNQHVKFLEIGLGCNMNYGPGASYYTWLEYFPDVDLYYIEYDARCADAWANKTTDATIFVGDQADVSFLEQVIQKSGGNFDVIIDDGGHNMTQQRTSLHVLWDAIKPGGVYFVEDLKTSYIPKYGGGTLDTFMEDLKHMLDDINKPRNAKSHIIPDLFNFEFTQECVALTKSSKPMAKH